MLTVTRHAPGATAKSCGPGPGRRGCRAHELREKWAPVRQECVSSLSCVSGRAHHGDVAHDEDMEPVAAPHCRERPLRRPPVAGEPEAKAVIVGDPVQAVVRVRLAPAASRRGFEQYLRTLACVRCGWQVTGDVDYEWPVVAVGDGGARLLVRRETAADMRQRDVGL
jgi:hypothetical protein